MSDWQDAESVDKTLAAWRKAVAELFAICPNMVPEGNDYRSPTPLSWRRAFGVGPQWRTIKDKFTSLSVCTSSLLDYNRALPITENTRTWEREFFLVSFLIAQPFRRWGWFASHTGCEPWTDQEGDHEAIPPTPKRLGEESYDLNVTLAIGGTRYGLRDWKVKRDEIANLCDGCSQSVRDAYAKYYARACDAVEQWEEAIAKVVSLRIPTGD